MRTLVRQNMSRRHAGLHAAGHQVPRLLLVIRRRRDRIAVLRLGDLPSLQVHRCAEVRQR